MRPRKCRLVRSSPTTRFLKPRGVPLCDLEVVKLKDEEYEAILLCDHQNMAQEEAAKLMGVSRPTFSRILSSARKAIAKALALGAALEIDGGDFSRLPHPSPKSTGDSL
ncbi:MAG: DUF134 domain-containing protein [Bdellovibrionales bacterium]